MSSASVLAPRRAAGDAPRRSPWHALPTSKRWRWVASDAMAMLVLLGLIAAVLYPVYGTWWLALTVGGFGALGMLVSLLAAFRQWRIGLTALLCVVGWFLVGTPLVMPSSGIGGVVPSGRSMVGLLLGPVTAWRDMLTLEPPIGETSNLLAVPGLIALAVGATGMWISLRTRFPMLAWVPAGLGYTLAAVLGSSVLSWPFVLAGAFFVVVLVWTSFRRAHLRTSLTGRRRRFRPLRTLLALAVLAAAGGAAMVLQPLLAPEVPRSTARQAVEPPITMEEFASPLQAFRANISKFETETLFEASGLEEGDILRVATMDSYDGMSFRVATKDDAAVGQTTFTRVGQWISDDTPGTPGAASIRVHAYEGVWVPTVGQSTQVRFGGERSVALTDTFFYNRASGTGVTPVGIESQDTYTLEFIRPHRPAEDQIRSAGAGRVQLPAVDGMPDELRNRAHEWAEGFPTAGAQALVLEASLREGYFSHGQEDEARSLSGHSAARLITLIANPEAMVGDGEQYASAMALMARELGIPARVIYGYRVGGTGYVTGADVGAWTEVYLEELGWVTFDPTPPKDREFNEEDVPNPPTPRPHIENPPPPPQRPEPPVADEELPVDPGDPPVQEEGPDWAQIGALVALTGIPFLTVVVPITLVLGLKLRRRSKRRNDPILANRVAGAWSEVVDRARDLGRSPSVSATRSEQAQQLAESFEKVSAKADPIAISREADWIVFAPGDPSEKAASEFWLTTKQVERGMRRSVRLPRWLASRLSTKSFRKTK